MTYAYILDAVRTPRGRGKAGKGALSGLHPQELLAQTIEQLIGRKTFGASDVEDLIVGSVTQVREQGANIARNAVLRSSLPQTTTGVTLNRFCGSGLQAVNFAAMGVMSGQQDLVLAGGVESMSRVPMGSDEAGMDGNNLELRKRIFQVPQGISADLIATLEGFSRETLDTFAAESQRKAGHAMAENRFARSLFAVKNDAGEVVLEKDELPRPETTTESLAQLRPAFEQLGQMAAGPNGETLDQMALAAYPQAKQIHHLHHAGNSSGIVDGAALVALASESYVRDQKLKPRARIRACTTVGSEPIIMLTAPAPASRRALKKAQMQASDIDLWEINEAFATVPLQTMRELELDPARVNVNGGAIALGHPLGATGAILVGTALDELERRGLATALVTLCIGGGMGIATILERV
ncbi:MAG: acetyl-CoA C-acetyltransferase [Polyangiaceae bacterium]|nr:acetyl-CoA C-acetyltransferase [Polyangiaceae bacterium]